jgi:hypothetical protein
MKTRLEQYQFVPRLHPAAGYRQHDSAGEQQLKRIDPLGLGTIAVDLGRAAHGIEILAAPLPFGYGIDLAGGQAAARRCS